MTYDEIARVCHEVNRAYCEALGDTSQPDWRDAPDWQKKSVLAGVRMHCMANISPSASHFEWAARKIHDGWDYGEVKDPVAKTHPCIVPFEDLPVEQRAKDFIFRAVVHALRDTAPVED